MALEVIDHAIQTPRMVCHRTSLARRHAWIRLCASPTGSDECTQSTPAWNSPVRPERHFSAARFF